MEGLTFEPRRPAPPALGAQLPENPVEDPFLENPAADFRFVSLPQDVTLSELKTANALYQRREYAAAVKSYKAFLDAAKDNDVSAADLAEAQFFQARALMHLEKFADAEGVLREFTANAAFADNPLAAEAQFRLAECCYRQGEFREVEESISSLLERHPIGELRGEVPEFFQWSLAYLGDARLNQQKFAAAEEAYRESLTKFASSTSADHVTLGLAKSLLRQERYEEALKTAASLKENGKAQYYEAVNALAAAAYEKREWPKATALFSQLVDDPVRSADARQTLAYLHVRSAYAEASSLEYAGEAAETLKKWQELRAYIGENRSLLRSEQFIAAVDRYDLAVGRKLLVGLERAGKADESNAIYRDLRERFPKEPLDDLLYGLAQSAYREAGELREQSDAEKGERAAALDTRAKELFTRLLADFPASDRGEHARAGLIQLALDAGDWAAVEKQSAALLEHFAAGDHAVFAYASLAAAQLQGNSLDAAGVALAAARKVLGAMAPEVAARLQPLVEMREGELAYARARALLSEGKPEDAENAFLRITVRYRSFPELAEAAEKAVAEIRRAR